METTPTIDQAADFFDAHTVELYPDVRDRAVHTVIDIRSGDGSTVRFFNAAEEEFMALRSAGVSLMASFDEMVQATRPYTDGEMDGLL